MAKGKIKVGRHWEKGNLRVFPPGGGGKARWFPRRSASQEAPNSPLGRRKTGLIRSKK